MIFLQQEMYLEDIILIEKNDTSNNRFREIIDNYDTTIYTEELRLLKSITQLA